MLKIGIIGPNNPLCSLELYAFGVELGTQIAKTDVIIAAGGGAGTLSEIAYSWQLGKKVLCVTHFDGWSKELAGRDLDARQKDLLIPVNSIDVILSYIDRIVRT